jgi:hypothetical protein
MKNIGKHIIEYYQQGKFLGTHTVECELSDDEVGYVNRTQITEGQVKTKRVYKATESDPIMVVKYNLQGR